MGLKVESKEVNSDTLQIEVEFKTDGKLSTFRKEKKGNRIELRIGSLENPESIAVLKEDRSTPGHLKVQFSIDHEHIDNASVWIIHPIIGIADVLRLKDIEALKTTQPRIRKSRSIRGATPIDPQQPLVFQESISERKKTLEAKQKNHSQ